MNNFPVDLHGNNFDLTYYNTPSYNTPSYNTPRLRFGDSPEEAQIQHVIGNIENMLSNINFDRLNEETQEKYLNIYNTLKDIKDNYYRMDKYNESRPLLSDKNTVNVPLDEKILRDLKTLQEEVNFILNNNLSFGSRRRLHKGPRGGLYYKKNGRKYYV